MTDFFKNQPKLKQYSFYCSLGGLVLAALNLIVSILYWQIPKDTSFKFIQDYSTYFFFSSFFIVGASQIGLLVTAKRPIPAGKDEQFAKQELLLDIVSACFFFSTFVLACIFVTFYNKAIDDWSRVEPEFKTYYDGLWAEAILGIILGAAITIITIKYRLLKLRRIYKGEPLSEGQEGLIRT